MNMKTKIIDLSKQYSIVTQLTSFVAIEKREEVCSCIHRNATCISDQLSLSLQWHQWLGQKLQTSRYMRYETKIPDFKIYEVWDKNYRLQDIWKVRQKLQTSRYMKCETKWQTSRYMKCETKITDFKIYEVWDKMTDFKIYEVWDKNYRLQDIWSVRQNNRLQDIWSVRQKLQTSRYMKKETKITDFKIYKEVSN